MCFLSDDKRGSAKLGPGAETQRDLGKPKYVFKHTMNLIILCKQAANNEIFIWILTPLELIELSKWLHVTETDYSFSQLLRRIS